MRRECIKFYSGQREEGGLRVSECLLRLLRQRWTETFRGPVKGKEILRVVLTRKEVNVIGPILVKELIGHVNHKRSPFILPRRYPRLLIINLKTLYTVLRDCYSSTDHYFT